jgi:hypothetical protein
MSILGRVTSRERGLKPGVYTVQITCSYAEAPDAAMKHFGSEPVKVSITEEHIKAAEVFWESCRHQQ